LIVVLLALNFPWTLASNESRSLTRLPVESRGLAFLTINPDPPVLLPETEDEFELDVVSMGRLVANGADVEVAGRRTTVRIVKGTRFWSAPFATFFFTIFMKSVESRNSFFVLNGLGGAVETNRITTSFPFFLRSIFLSVDT
jgi:hypothetical protein